MQFKRIHENNYAAAPLGVYIHWPYCRKKCPYCDFNSHVSNAIDTDAWLKAFDRALTDKADILAARTLKTVFFGGGTPSLMPVHIVDSVLASIEKLSGQKPWEVTLEANPTSVESSNFKALAKAGVNRLSMGVQALNDDDLRFLGREHTAAEALAALEIARSCFDRISFDLIYARPGQNAKTWADELKQALSLDCDHHSLYQLTIEPQTPFFMMARRGDFTIPDDEQAADLYLMTEDLMRDRGFHAYEISNYARPGFECRHNLIYWRGEEYLGIGPGAHGRIYSDGKWLATRQHRSPDIWLEKTLNDGGSETRERLSGHQRLEERIMLGLRMEQGVELTTLARDFGHENVQEALNQNAIQAFEDHGYLKRSDTHLRVTMQGRLVLDSLLAHLLH